MQAACGWGERSKVEDAGERQQGARGACERKEERRAIGVHGQNVSLSAATWRERAGERECSVQHRGVCGRAETMDGLESPICASGWRKRRVEVRPQEAGPRAGEGQGLTVRVDEKVSGEGTHRTSRRRRPACFICARCCTSAVTGDR